MSSLTAERLHELVEIRLRQNQLRYTKGRQIIVETLFASGHPLSISEIERLAPALPRSSAYRHLLDLQSVGAVRSVTSSGDFTHFELSEDLTEHHHHLICLRCNAIRDVAPSSDFEVVVERAVTDLTKSTGFEALSHSLDVMGYCANCR